MRWFCKKGNLIIHRILSYVLVFVLSLTCTEVLLGSTTSTSTDAEDLEYLKELEVFPESYRPYLLLLHKAHPTWTFEPVNTGLEWDVVMENECKLKSNLVPGEGHSMALKGVEGEEEWHATPTSWKSTEIPGAYDWTNNCWVAYDTGAWVQASAEAIAYVMDPRNWLTENNIFEFEQLAYNSTISDEVYLEALNNMVQNTFMKDAKVGGSGGLTYAEVFLLAGKTYNVSPLSLCARVINEKGTGTYNAEKDAYILSDTLGYGVVSSDGENYHKYNKSKDKGLTVYYNFFNIGACGTGADVVLNNGAKEAVQEGWTTRYKALMGGASKFASGYSDIGQDTLYFQKFSVVNPTYYYWKQYMQNLVSPVNEGYVAKVNYEKANLLDCAFNFRIPVYLNMPEYACENPSVTYGMSTANPNNKLKSLSIEGISELNYTKEYTLTPYFHMDTQTYSISVPYDISSVKITAESIAGDAVVKGTGIKNLNPGNNTIKINCQSAYGTVRTYRIKINRAQGSTLLDRLKVSAGKLSQAFDSKVTEYEMSVGNEVTELKLYYTVQSETAKVILHVNDTVTELGVGKHKTDMIPIEPGVTDIQLEVYPSATDDSASTTYSVKVTRYDQYQMSTDYQLSDTRINGIAVGTTVSQFKKNFTIYNGKVVVQNASRVDKKSKETIATGDLVTFYDANGKRIGKTRRVIVFGDVNGDGTIDLMDFAYMKFQVLKKSKLKGVYKEAANLNHDEMVDLMDLGYIKFYVLKGREISQTIEKK